MVIIMTKYKVYVMELNETMQIYFVSERHDYHNYQSANDKYNYLITKYNFDKYCEFKVKLTATTNIITIDGMITTSTSDYRIIHQYNSRTLEIKNMEELLK